MKGVKVICFGEALVDRLGPCGGDPETDQPMKDFLGGAPANVACGLARLGINVGFIGCVGNDSTGDSFRQLFLSRSIDISGLQIHSKLPTRVVLVSRDFAGERTFAGFAGQSDKGFADQEFELSQLKLVWDELVRDADYLLLGTIPLASKRSKEAVLWILSEARKNDVKVVMDINWRPIFWNEKFPPNAAPNFEIKSLIQVILERAFLIKLADEEAMWFFNTNNPKRISNSLPQKPNVIVTDGSKPIHWFVGDESGEMNTVAPQKIVDTTGAGDCFTAGLLSQLVNSPSAFSSRTEVKKIISFAAACGALVCAVPGAIDSQPNAQEVREFMGSFD